MARSPTVEILVVLAVFFAVQTLLGLFVPWETVLALFALSMPLDVAPWTLVTSVYAHAGPAHLLGNAVMFALLGLILERHTTAGRFHLFVLGTGIATGLFQILLVGFFGESAGVLGLSGAVFAMLGYLLASNRVTEGLFSVLGLSSKVQFVLFVALAVVVTWVTAAPGVALGGHFFGILIGLVSGRANVLEAR